MSKHNGEKKMRFNQVVLEARKHADLSQEGLGKKIGCSAVYIGQIERKNDPKYPSVDFIVEKLCPALELDPQSTVELAISEASPLLYKIITQAKEHKEERALPPSKQAMVDKLLTVLNSANVNAIKAVTGTINMMFNAVKPSVKKGKDIEHTSQELLKL